MAQSQLNGQNSDNSANLYAVVWEAVDMYIRLNDLQSSMAGKLVTSGIDAHIRYYDLTAQFPCCERSRMASQRGKTLDMYHHGRTIVHIASYYGIIPLLLRRAIVARRSGRGLDTKGFSAEVVADLVGGALSAGMDAGE